LADAGGATPIPEQGKQTPEWEFFVEKDTFYKKRCTKEEKLVK
jgi:hypothetical protein